MSEKIRLYRINPHRYDIMILLAVAIVLFIIGITEPVVTFEKMIFEKNSFSILSGIIAFFRQNQMFVGIIVFLFSIVFPVVKFIWLIILWFGKFKESRLRNFLNILKLLGRWSMLDFFVILITAGSMDLGILAEAYNKKRHLFFWSGCLSVHHCFVPD